MAIFFTRSSKRRVCSEPIRIANYRVEDVLGGEPSDSIPGRIANAGQQGVYIESGRALLLEYCAACHGRSAAGDGPMATALTPAPSDLTAVSGYHPDGDFFWKIENGKGAMPGFREKLSDQQIWHLVNYIQSLEKAQ